MGRNIDDLVDDRAHGLQSTGEKFHDAFLLQRPKNEWSAYIDETAKDICFGIQIGDLTLSKDNFGRELGNYYRRGLKQTVGRYADLPSVLDQHVSDEKLGLLAYQLNEFSHDIATNEQGIDDVDKATEALVEKLLTRHVGSDLNVSFDLSGATVADITTQLFNNKTIASNVDLLLTEIEKSASQGLLSLLDEPQMMTPLWDHQRDALQKWWKQDQRGYVDMATATGKTVLGLGAIALQYGELHPDDQAIGGLASGSETTGSDDILIVAHSDLILEQWRRAFEKHLNIPQERTTGSDDITLHWGTIHFRTPQSLINDRQAGYDLVLLDEAHHYATGSEWGSLLDGFDGDILAMSGSVDDAGSDSKRIKDRLSNSVGPQIKRYTIAEARTDGVIPSFDWEVHYAPYDVVGDELEKIATRADQAFTDFQTRLSQGELTLDTDRRLKTYEDVRRFSHTNEGNHLKQQDEEFRDLVTRLFSRRTKKWNLSPVLDAVVDLVVEHHTTEQVVVLADSNAQVEELESRLNDVVANPASVYLVSGSQSRTEQRETIDKFDEPEISGVLLGTGDLLGEGVDMQHASVAINMATGGVNQALVQRIGRILRNPTDTPKHAMFYNIVGVPPTDAAAVHREDGKQLIEQAAGFCSLGRRFETLPGFAISKSLDSSMLKNLLDKGTHFINTLEADGEYDWDNEIIKQDDLEALLDTVQSTDGDTETILGEWEEYAWKQSTDQLGTIEDPPNPIDSTNKKTGQSDTQNDGSAISNADDEIPAIKRSRIEDIVTLQPAELSGLQIKWKLSSQREIEEYLRSELSAYHFRDDAGLVWASDKAETIVETLDQPTNGLSTSDLLEEIRRLNDKLGHVPTRAEMKNSGEYSLDHYEEAFDSWSAAVREAGYTPHGTVPKSYTREEVVHTLREIAADLEKVPSSTDINEHAPFSSPTIHKHFDSVSDAKQAAGVDQIDETTRTVVEDGIQANALSEYYDLFRTFASLLEEFIESDQTPYSIDNGSPMDKWHTEIRNVVFGSGLTEDAPNYGEQQGSQNPHEMGKYRQAFGDGQQVTDYQCVPAERLGEANELEVQIQRHITEPQAEVYLPIAPQTEIPLPIVVDSQEELEVGLRLLDEFPAEPAPATDGPDDSQTESESYKKDDQTTAEGHTDRSDTAEDDRGEGPGLSENKPPSEPETDDSESDQTMFWVQNVDLLTEYEAEDTAEVDGDPMSSQTVEPNPVSELYEAFRSLRTVLDAIIEYPESAVSASETSHPVVQYRSVIQAVVGTEEYLPEGVDGFGGQQADRVPSEMTEYRAAYGTESSAYRTKYPVSGSKSWITAYQTIDAAPLADKTQEALEEHDIVEDASAFVRPVAPATGTPLPLLPWSSDELVHALSLLSQFEARPELPWDDDNQGEFPIEEVYERVCIVEGIDPDHRVTLDRGAEDQLPTTTASSEMGTTTQEPPKDRCGFMWPPTGSSSDGTQRASCCYRETWSEFDRCIWHADTEIEKPVKELKDTRESESNRLHNHLPREILAGAILRETQLTDEILTGVDFRGADFEGCEFTDTYLSYATFTDANLRGTDFTETTVSRVSFRDTDLTNATLTDLSLYNTDFTGATLTYADFTGAKIEHATVTNATIEDAVGVDATDRDEVESNDEDDVETESSPEEIDSPSNATDLTTDEDTSLVVTTDTHIDRKNMGRIGRQKDYLSAFAEVTQHAVNTDADAVVHLGNLFWTTGSRDRASDGLEEHLQTLAAQDIDFLLVQAPKESTANSTVLDTLEQRGLLTILDSGWHQIGSVGLLVHGVDAETITDQTTTPPADTTTTVAALYDEITTATTYSDASELETAVESELDLILTGTSTVTNTTTESGTPLFSPGMPERIIGKSTIDSTPSTPGFLQCEVTGDEINTTRHETAARPVAGFRIELSADATKTDVVDALPAELPTEAAAMFEIDGEKTDESLSKKEIEKIVSQRVAIVRGYDERTELSLHTTTDGTNSTNRTDENSTESNTNPTATTTTEETKTDATTPTVESIAASSVFDVDSIKRKVDKLQARGATREEALSCVSQYTHDREHDEGLYSVPGIGLTVGYKLATHGVTSRDELTTEHLDIIKQIDGISDHHIEPLVEAVDGLEKPTTTTTETQETDLAVAPNRLSEYYDTFQTVRKVISAVLQVEGTGIVPDDLTHPAVQYYVLLDACLSYGLSELNFTGYGLQHQDRLSISIDEYRDAYGDSDTKQVIDHQEIPVESYTDDTQSWLANNTWLTDTDQFSRPIAPESEYPLPEMVTTKQELLGAVELLNEFPAYPSIPGEMDTRDRTIPIKTLYQDLFAEVNDEHLIDLTLLSPPGQASGEPVTGPVADATPTSQADADSMLLDYGKLSHLFRRVAPPSDSPIQQQLPVFGLDWYRQRSPSFTALQSLAKYDDDEPITHFEPRLQDMVHRRFLRDRWNYDYITVFPSHEKETLNPSLVDLAQEAVVETSMVYTPLLERTETTDRQREKSEAGRKQVAIDPGETLRVRAALNGETVVLLDDICTTGSSLLAGAYLLREAGASRVVGVTLGFTPGGPADNVSVIEKPDAYASEIIAGIE